MTDEALRNYLGAMSFLLAALSFLANERRESIASLYTRGDVSKAEKRVAVATVALLFAAALGLVVSAVPVLRATGLEPGDLLRVRSAIREAFILGWVLLVAITLALGALVVRAWKVTPQASEVTVEPVEN
jgi:H+/Cl- antiporter ClcA